MLAGLEADLEVPSWLSWGFGPSGHGMLKIVPPGQFPGAECLYYDVIQHPSGCFPPLRSLWLQ